MAGKCSYESLKNGSLDLADIDRMNEALDVEAYNRKKFEDYLKTKTANGRRR